MACMAVAQAYGQSQKPESKAPETKTSETRTVVLKAARLFDGKSNSLVTPGLAPPAAQPQIELTTIIVVPGMARAACARCW